MVHSTISERLADGSDVESIVTGQNDPGPLGDHSKENGRDPEIVSNAEVHHSESIRKRKRTICMAGLFYTVDLSRDERMARNPRLVDKFLVELCREHCPDNWHETDRESLAIATALKALEHRYSPEVVGGVVGHKEATRYKDIIPTNLGEEHFSLSCGCRAWKI